MARQTRRSFLKHALSAAATVTVAGTKSSGKVLGANEAVRLAVAGLNGRGGEHVDAFSKVKGVEIVYLVDPDTRVYKKRLDQLKKLGRPEAACVQDVRKALDDKNVDALSVATPNHWHALMTIWGCQAGKDVYVEKPASHNVHEGRIAVEVARRNKRIVQHGTQGRSDQKWADLAAIAKGGQLGKLLVSRGLCYKDGGTDWNTRGDIGTAPPKAPPAELDFNLWCGPAPDQPYHENLVHYRWHWFWDFGNGDIGNQGVHQMDIARWMIPGATWPKSVVSLGGRFANNDQGQTPNAQVTVMDYGDTLLIFEVRGLKSPKYRDTDSGNVLHFEAGTVAGGKFYPKDGDKPAPLPKAEGAEVKKESIFENFIACVRNRKADELHAEVGVGHVSAGLCHLANASYRLGTDAPFNSVGGRNDTVNETLTRLSDHLNDHGLKPQKTTLKVGRKLEIDGHREKVKNDPEANTLLTRKYRPPFVVPDRPV